MGWLPLLWLLLRGLLLWWLLVERLALAPPWVRAKLRANGPLQRRLVQMLMRQWCWLLLKLRSLRR
jgi:hypothetical protein